MGRTLITPNPLPMSLQEIAECLQQNAKSEKATAFLIWKALLFSVVALTTISEHLHHRIYFTVANILQSPVCPKTSLCCTQGELLPCKCCTGFCRIFATELEDRRPKTVPYLEEVVE